MKKDREIEMMPPNVVEEEIKRKEDLARQIESHKVHDVEGALALAEEVSRKAIDTTARREGVVMEYGKNPAGQRVKITKNARTGEILSMEPVDESLGKDPSFN